MPVNLDNTTQDDVMTAIRDRCANGTVEIGTAGMATVLVTFGLSGTGGSIGSQTWTFAFDASTEAATASGTAAACQIKDSGGTVRLSGLTVATTGADVNLDNTSINSGQNVTLSSGQIVY